MFVDKRIGEQNEELGEFDKAILRSQRERRVSAFGVLSSQDMNFSNIFMFNTYLGLKSTFSFKRKLIGFMFYCLEM